MNYMFWYVRGLENPAKRRIVAEVIRNNSIEIACLEETKLDDATSCTLREIVPNNKFRFICKNSRGASGGIIVAYNEDFYNLINKVEGEFSLTALLSIKKDEWLQMVTIVYGPNN